MNKMLKKKKFLLVIDNVWCDREDHRNNWDTLFRCLSKCVRGSKILVTSQTDDAPRKIRATRENIHRLEELEENDFLDLVIYHALPSGVVDSFLREELAEKCKTIAKKLNKDPTAAEMVGKTIAIKVADLLQSQDDLNAYLSTIAQKDWYGDNTQALTWSYRHLPAHLQRCFSYCSLYPRGYKFKALELIKLWMAQGFIKPDDQDKRMEDVGYGYLDELVSRFYIQHHNSYYTLHELLYDLAEKVSRNDCVRIEGNRQSQIPSTIRHLRIPANKLNDNKEEICELKKLRTLIVTKVESVTSEENVAPYVFKSLKKLRVLVSEINLENLAEFISEMKHLRVLRVSDTREFVLPESVCTLYQLQVLEVENASSLPKFLTNLVSLRYLQAKSDIISAMPDIGKLTSLQGLENFQVRQEEGYEQQKLDFSLKEQPKKLDCKYETSQFIARPKWQTGRKIGYVDQEQLQSSYELRGRLRIANLEDVKSKEKIESELKQLQNLNELRGRLCIANLENVKSKESAIAANLKEKKYLDILQLEYWYHMYPWDCNVGAEILEGLQLPPNLTGLSLAGYRGRSCPSWPEYQTGNIQELALRRCKMLEELPLMDQIFPSCRSLELSDLSKLKALHALPRQLTTLIIENTPSLIFVTKEDLQMSPAEKRSIIEVMRISTREWFPHQYEKSIGNNEREMMKYIAAMNDSSMDIATDVRKRWLERCERKTPVWERWLEMHERKMELIYSRQNEARLHLPSTLTGLQLKGCNITNHALSACLQTLTSLTYLLLAEIRTVTCLPSEDVLGKLKALQYLSLAECWALSSLGGIGSLPHLKELCLSGCPCLDSETTFLQSSLEIITFESCADVDVILADADLPCLSDLTITRCHMRTASLQFGNLQSLRSLDISHCPGSFSADLQELHSLEILILHNCPNLKSPQMSLAEKRSIIEVMGKSKPEWFLHQYGMSLLNNAREMMNFIAAMNDSNSEASSSQRKKRVSDANMDITTFVWEHWLEMHERKMELIYSRQNEGRLHLPSNLTSLQLEECNITDHALSACLQTLTSLTCLSLAEIRTVTRLPSEDVLGKLKTLKYLSLAECWALSSLGGIGSLPHLKEFFLIGCPSLDSETAFLPSSLEIITFESCVDVDVILANADLPWLSDLTITRCHMRTASLQFGSLPSLRSLDISHCPGSFSVDLQELHSLGILILHNCSNLEAVTNLTRSLTSLEIHECPILEKQSINVDPLSGVRMLGDIPIEDSFEHDL